MGEKRNEFRKYKKEIHPKYVYEKEKDTYIFLSMTHNPPKEKIKDYTPLVHSADPNDSKKAYISNKAEQDKIDNFGARKKGWKFTKEDDKKVKKIIKQNKKGKH